MYSYYANQVKSLPQFSGHYRKRGSGFGALASGIGRVALPLARRSILPTAKRIGREHLKQGVFRTSRCSIEEKVTKTGLEKHSLKRHKKQTGRRSRRVQQRPRKQTGSRLNKLTKKRKTSFISKSRAPKRNRSDFFAKVKDDR